MEKMGIQKRRNLGFVMTSGLWYLNWGVILAVKPTLYPEKAEEKGVSPTFYGLIFGIISLSSLVTAPFCGKFGATIGPRFLLCLGSLLQGISMIGLGLLDLIHSTNIFIVTSIFLSLIDGFADCIAWVSVNSILLKVFQNQVTIVTSLSEITQGLGLLIGPFIGSTIFYAGGYIGTFVIIGLINLIITLSLFLTVPTMKCKTDIEATELEESKPFCQIASQDEEHTTKDKKSISILSFYKYPSIALPMIDQVLGMCGDGMIQSMLDVHILAIPNTQQSDVSTTFQILGGCFMISSIATGYACKLMEIRTVVTLIGNILLCLGFLLMGPLANNSLVVINISAGLMGSGIAIIIISTFVRSHETALAKGYDDDLDTYLFITSLWIAAYYLGNFVGPSVSGILVEKSSFSSTCCIFIGLFSVIIVTNSLEIGYELWIKLKNKIGRNKFQKYSRK